MGNICGKADSDNFSQPGRVLGSTPEQPQRASIPAGTRVGGRKLGGGGGGGGGGAGAGDDPDEPRRRAAAAAEARKNESSAKLSGPLGQKLKAQNKGNPLAMASEEERGHRAMDEAAQNLAHN